MILYVENHIEYRKKTQLDQKRVVSKVMGSKRLQMVLGLQFDDSANDFFSLYEGVKAACIQGKPHLELSFPGLASVVPCSQRLGREPQSPSSLVLMEVSHCYSTMHHVAK